MPKISKKEKELITKKLEDRIEKVMDLHAKISQRAITAMTSETTVQINREHPKCHH